MRGTIQAVDYTADGATAIVTIAEENGDISLVHCDGGPLLQALRDGELEVGDVIEHKTIPIAPIEGPPN